METGETYLAPAGQLKIRSIISMYSVAYIDTFTVTGTSLFGKLKNFFTDIQSWAWFTILEPIHLDFFSLMSPKLNYPIGLDFQNFPKHPQLFLNFDDSKESYSNSNKNQLICLKCLFQNFIYKSNFSAISKSIFKCNTFFAYIFIHELKKILYLKIWLTWEAQFTFEDRCKQF